MFKKIHKKQWDYLSRIYDEGKLSHAYLFSGPKGVGKFEIATSFIQKVNLIDEKEAVFKKADVFLIRPEIEENKGKIREKKISIDSVKEATDKVGYYSLELEYKFLVIQDADKLTPQAANSLLKLIEEPPTKTLIILISSNEDSVLSTLKSRCQVVRFHLAGSSILEKELAVSLTKEVQDLELLKRMIDFSEGRSELAKTFTEDQAKFEEIGQFKDSFRKALRGGVAEGFSLAEKVSKDRYRALLMMDEWILYLRKFLLERISSDDNPRVIQKVAYILDELIKLKKIINRTNVNLKVQLENFFIRVS